MDRNSLITSTVAKETKDQGLERIVESMMEMLQESFNEIDIRIRNTTTVFEVEEVSPSLHVVMKRRVTPLIGHRGLHNRGGNPRVTSDIGQKPNNLITTEFSSKMLGGFRVGKVGTTASKRLMENLVIELPVVVTMSR